MTRRTGREGLHERVVEGERRHLEHSRAPRRADERREVEAERPRARLVEDERTLYRGPRIDVTITRHTETGRRAVQVSRVRSRSGFVERFVLFESEDIEAVAHALQGAIGFLESDDLGATFRPRRPG